MSQDTQPQPYTPQVTRCRTCGRTSVPHTAHCEAHQPFAGQWHFWRHGQYQPRHKRKKP